MTKELKPKLRFPSFEHEWTTTKLKGVSNYQKGFAFKSEDYRCSGARIIRVSDLSVDSIKLDNEKIYIDQENVSKYGRYIINSGEVIITTVGSRPHLKESAVGRAIFVEKGEEHLLNQNLLKLEFDDENVSNFIFRYLNSPRYIDYITSIQRGNANQSNIAVKDLLEYPLSITSKEEQQKIADFLSSVDNKISLLKEKYDLLTQYKKGVMQKLFKQKIRFKDDNGNDFPDWESVTLNDLMTESRIKGSTGDKARKMTVKLWGKGVFEKDDKLGGSENTQYYKRKSGQFIYSKLDFLNCAFGIVPDELDGLETTVDLPCFDIESGINKYFILAYIKQKRFYKKYGDMADGSRKAKRIHAETFLNFPVNLPCEKEQDKIADFLTAIDKKLDAVNRQVELTQTFKRGLLQQMFV